MTSSSPRHTRKRKPKILEADNRTADPSPLLVFIFFLLCAFYYAYEYIETRSYRDLLLTVLFLLLINFIRFEGWLFSLLILFVLIESKMSLRALIIYLSPISALILFVLIISRQMTGDAFWGLNESDRFVKNSLIGIDPLVNAKDIPDAFVAFGIRALFLSRDSFLR